MQTQNIPSAEEIKAALAELNMAGLHVVADKSGVPFHTLLKIRGGETENPRIETVRQFWPVIQAGAKEQPEAA